MIVIDSTSFLYYHNYDPLMIEDVVNQIHLLLMMYLNSSVYYFHIHFTIFKQLFFVKLIEVEEITIFFIFFYIFNENIQSGIVCAM